MAFTHVRDNCQASNQAFTQSSNQAFTQSSNHAIKQASNKVIKQEDRFHHYPHTVGLAKAHPNKVAEQSISGLGRFLKCRSITY